MAYIAGFLEGEGSFQVIPKTSTTGEMYPTFRIAANSTDEDVLRRVAQMVGFGNLTGPCEPQKLHHKPFWRFQIHKRDDCYLLALALYPHMGRRRQEQLAKLIEAYNCSRRARWQHGTRQGYEYHKCRCGLCRASNTQRHSERRARRRIKDACVHGHPYDKENTYVRSDGYRSCRKCGNLNKKKASNQR